MRTVPIFGDMEATASPLQPLSPVRAPVAAPRPWLLCVSVAVLALLAMAGAITGPFLFDDVALIQGNHYVHGFGQWTSWFTGTLWDTNYDPSIVSSMPKYWRPIVLASYALDWSLGQGSPLMFHATNSLVHAVNCALLLHVLTGWVKSRWSPWLAAAIYAVHPVQTESVAFIAGRTDSLCVLGMLITIIGIRARRRMRFRAIVAQSLGILLAFGSKEAAAVLPVFVFIEFWSEEHKPLTWPTIRAAVVATLPYLAVALLFGATYMLAFRSDRAAGPSLLIRLGFILEAWGRYTVLVLWPGDLTLGRALLRSDTSGGVLWRADYAAVGGCFAAAVLAAAWKLRLRAPSVTLGLLAYAALLLPVSGVVWLGYDVLVSPRFLYIPMIGLVFALAGALACVERRQLVVGLACGLVLPPYAIRSFVRSCDYDSEQAFWRAEIERNPAYQSAQQWFIMRELREGRPRSALLLAHEWFKAGEEGNIVQASRANLVVSTLQATLALTPDVDRESLVAVRDFVAALANGGSPELKLPALALELRLSDHPILLVALRSARRRLDLMLAEVHSRIGDDAAVLAAVDRATLGCGECWTVLSGAAIPVARAGDLARAESLARDAQSFGPPGGVGDLLGPIELGRQWRARRGFQPAAINDAGFYSALGAYGRAYAAAAPAIRNPPSERSSVRALAELAFRAGDIKTARRLLEAAFSRSIADQIIAELGKTVSWQDRPMDPQTWVPGRVAS